ncbi:MAG: MATE family efflux transporter [Bacteroidales bacterium]|nr:MATE family efflux transporter [Bacteroidales bacterium]
MPSNTPSIKKIWVISWPIMISLVAQNIVNVTDTAFLGHVGSVELGASAIGGLFYVTLFMVAYGFTTGVQILIARRNGEKDYPAIGSIFDNGFYFLGFSTLVITALILLFGAQILKPFIASENVYSASIIYLKYRIFGLFFASSALLFRSFYTGIEFTKYISISAAIMAGLNVILDYGMIFGKLGFPEMGIAGAGLASSISEACALLFFFAITARRAHLAKYKLFAFVKPDLSIIKKTLDVSLYIMMQFVLSHAVWFGFFLLIEKMGETSLAVSNIIRSIYMLLMIPAWAMSSATSSIVSNAIGAGFSKQVIPIVTKVLVFSMGIMLAVAVLAAFIPHFMISIYTNDTSLQQASVASYYIILGAVFLFSATIVLFNGVLGTGNTRSGLAIEVFTLSLYLVFAWFLAIKLHVPIEVVWLCEYMYAIVLGTLSWIYLRVGKWEGRVI